MYWISSSACGCLGRARPDDLSGLVRPVGWMFPTPAWLSCYLEGRRAVTEAHVGGKGEGEVASCLVWPSAGHWALVGDPTAFMSDLGLKSVCLGLLSVENPMPVESSPQCDGLLGGMNQEADLALSRCSFGTRARPKLPFLGYCLGSFPSLRAEMWSPHLHKCMCFFPPNLIFYLYLR